MHGCVAGTPLKWQLPQCCVTLESGMRRFRGGCEDKNHIAEHGYREKRNDVVFERTVPLPLPQRNIKGQVSLKVRGVRSSGCQGFSGGRVRGPVPGSS